MASRAGGRIRRTPGRVTIPVDNGFSTVRIGAGALGGLKELVGGRPAVAVIDAVVARRHAAALDAALGPDTPRLRLKGGEQVKTPADLERVWRWFAARGLPRDGLVVGIGGGTVLDLAGFAAATWMRGTEFASVPTTLLAAADASVGGKTAVDLDGLKNPVGAFHAATDVLIDPTLLATLPRREWRCGLAEIVKIAVIDDAPLFRALEARADDLADRFAAGRADRPVPDAADLPWSDWLESAVAAKARVVARDYREGGHRRVLNLGHTLAHALEPLMEIPHGEAVALGMAAVCRVAAKQGLCTAQTRDRAVALLQACGLPVTCRAPRLAAVRRYVERDKKKAGGMVGWVVPRKLGGVERDVVLPLDEVLKSLSG